MQMAIMSLNKYLRDANGFYKKYRLFFLKSIWYASKEEGVKNAKKSRKQNKHIN